MGKKRAEKGREWEKERRDKLNAVFQELCKLLPDHDPSINMSKMEILTKATEYIKHLQEKNEEIIKCGNHNFLKSETERLKKRVAYLILKTTELVDALRQAGVPIPSKSKKKNNTKAKTKVGVNSTNQQNNDPSLANKIGNNRKTRKITVKKEVKCGCEKKLQLNKKPLTEVNPMVSAGGTSVSCAVTASVSNSVSEVCNGVVSQSTSNCTMSSPSSTDNSTQQIITQNADPSSTVTEITSASGSVTQSVVHPVKQPTVSVFKQPQKLSVHKKELSKLGPGTLIFADGLIVNVPPVIPQIVVKPPPPAPPPAVILMQTPEIALQKPIVKLTTANDKKEKFIVPKKREITMTTFVNKVPIPAVKAFRLESCSKERKPKKKTNKEQKKSQSADSTSPVTTSTSNVVTNTTTNSVVVTSPEATVAKRKRQEEPNTVNKAQKNDTVDDQAEPLPSKNHSYKDEKSPTVKYSIDGIFSKQTGNDVEGMAVTSTEASSVHDQHNSESDPEKMVSDDVSTASVSTLIPPAEVVNVNSVTTSTTEGNVANKSSEVMESLQPKISTDESVPAVTSDEAVPPVTSLTMSLPMDSISSSNSLTEVVASELSDEPKTSGVTDVISTNTQSLCSSSLPLVTTKEQPICNTCVPTTLGLTSKELPKNAVSSCNIINEIPCSAPLAKSTSNIISNTSGIYNKMELTTTDTLTSRELPKNTVSSCSIINEVPYSAPMAKSTSNIISNTNDIFNKMEELTTTDTLTSKELPKNTVSSCSIINEVPCNAPVTKSTSNIITNTNDIFNKVGLTQTDTLTSKELPTNTVSSCNIINEVPCSAPVTKSTSNIISNTNDIFNKVGLTPPDSLTSKELPKSTVSSCSIINEVPCSAPVAKSTSNIITNTSGIFNKTPTHISTASMEVFPSSLSSTVSTTYPDTFSCSSFIPPKVDVPNANVSRPTVSETFVNKTLHITSPVYTPSRAANMAVTATTTIPKVSDNSVSGRYINTKTNESKTFISSGNCSNLSTINMPPTTSVFGIPQSYTPSVVSNVNTSKSSGAYVMPDVFANNSHIPPKSMANFNIDYSYNNTTNLARTMPSYTMADVFVNTNPLGHTSSTVNLNNGSANTISTSGTTSASFRMPSVSVCSANALSKTFASSSYSMTDVFVTNMHLSHKNPSTFSSSVSDSCCIPPIVSKHSSSCCMNSSNSSNTTTGKPPTYTKRNLFPSITSSTYKSSSTFGTVDIGVSSTSVATKPTTAFSMTDMFNHNVATTTKMTTFNMPDVYTTYNTPLCSSKTSSVFSVADVLTTSGTTVSKTSHAFTMSDLYMSNPVTCKSSHPFTMSGITSSTQNSTAAFTVSNVSTDLPNKACEQIATTLPSVADNTPLYDTQHKIPPVPIITPSKQYNTGEKDKTYPISTIANNFNKNDHCNNDFLRSTKDIDRSFMPIMDDVRLTSDFSNDLFFSSLQVPSGGHHTESISPTAAFLLAFPLVSTSKNTENLADTENHDNHTSTPTTILQIGNIEPPSTELFHSVDFAKSKDFEVQTDLDYKSKQKPKHKNNPPTFNQSYSYPLFPNDYNHQCDVNWSKPMEKKKPEKVQKYQYDCYKQDKKKRKISVNWMTTPENDIYREAEFPSSSGQYNIEMETFPDLCNNKKNQGNYSWSPSKSLLPLDNPLMIPSTLPTLVGDLALGTTTPSDPFKRCEKKDKQEEKKFAQPKSQSANFLSVSQLVDPKCKKQKPTTERQYNKQKQIVQSTTDKKRQCMGPSTNHQRDYQTTSKRKESNDPSCMYPDNFVPHFNWDNKHRYKGGSYSAESLIQQDVCDTFNFNYQQNNFFQNSEFGHDTGQSGCGQYQNFLNISQGHHFSSCVSEEYPTENFTLTSQPNNRMGAPPIGQGVLHTSNDKQRNISHPIKDLHLRDETGYHCGSGSTAPSTFHHYPPHNHHQQHQQQHPTGYSTTNLQHNFSSVGGSGSGPPVPPPPPLPPPVSNYSVTTTSTLANFNLSTIFPEMNDQRVGAASGAPPRSHLNTFSNNQTCRGHVSMH